MKKKMFLCCFTLFVLSLFCISLNADELISVNIYEENYTLSEHDEISLPFVNEVSSGTTTLDKDIHHSGITITGGEINVLNYLKGVHLLVTTNDTVHIKGSIDYPIIIAQNVILEGTINGDMVIYAPNVVIKENAKVLGDILISATDVSVEGEINGNFIAYVENELKLSGKLNSNLRASVGSIVLSDEKINGDILIKTNSDTTSITEKYENAKIEALDEEKEDIGYKIIIAVFIVILYTVIGYIVTRKDNNLFARMLNNSKNKLSGVVLSGAIMLLASIVLVILCAVLAIVGLWKIAVPFIVGYLGFVIFMYMFSVFILGSMLFEWIKYDVIKNIESNFMIKKIGLLFLIYGVLYALTVIPFISSYIPIVYGIFSIGAVISYIKQSK